MSDSVSFARRRALKLLASAPMLPLASSSLAGIPLLAEAAPFGRPEDGLLGRSVRPGMPVSYSFSSMAAPSLAEPAKMATTYVASTLTKRVGRHQSQTFALGYDTFFLTGDEVPRTGGGTIVAGGYYDIDGTADPSIPPRPTSGSSSPTARTGCRCIQLDGGCFPAPRLRSDLRGRAVRIHVVRIGGGEHVRQAAVADRGADTGPGPAHGPAEPGELSQRRYLPGQGPVDHLRREQVAVEHASVERGIRARRDDDCRAMPSSRRSARTCSATSNAANPYDYGHLPEVVGRTATAPASSGSTTASAASRTSWCR